MDIVSVIARFLHIASAVALVGGLLFFLAGVLPVLKKSPDPAAQELLAAIRKRFFRIAHPSIMLLILTGVWQWWQNFPLYRQATGPLLQALLGTKVLLAMIAFVIAFAAPMNVLPGCPGKWAKVNLALGVAILILAAVVRSLHMGLLEPSALPPMP